MRIARSRAVTAIAVFLTIGGAGLSLALSITPAVARAGGSQRPCAQQGLPVALCLDNRAQPLATGQPREHWHGCRFR